MHRLYIEGVAQHVIQRGNNRADLFRDPYDYEAFLYSLRDAATRHDVEIHAYVLMTNHVHLMMTPGSPSALPATMQALGRRYVHYFNRRHQRTGGLFEGRYRSLLIDSEAYLFTCMRYIELNPVRAGIVSEAGSYRWSTYRMHAAGERDLVARPHPLYAGLAASPLGRQRAWRELCGSPVEGDELAAIRAAISGAGARNAVALLAPVPQP